MERMLHPRRHRRDPGSGYILLGLLLFMALMMLALTIAAPRVATDMQREREQELIRRGNEYAKAVKKYYRKFGQYPNSIEQLESTNNMRFLRKRFVDPITGKDDWRVIHMGQVKFPPRNFGAPGAAQGGGGITGAVPAAQAGGGQPSTSPTGQQQGGRAGDQPQQPGTPASQISRPAGTGQTFGGGPIVGVASSSEKEGIKELNGRSRYSEWEFVYDPRLDPSLQQGGVPGVPGQGQGQQQRQPGRGGPIITPPQGTPPQQNPR